MSRPAAVLFGGAAFLLLCVALRGRGGAPPQAPDRRAARVDPGPPAIETEEPRTVASAPTSSPVAPLEPIRERRKGDVLRRTIEALRLEPEEAARFEREVLRTLRRIGAAWMEREAAVLAPFADGCPQAQENYERAKEEVLSELLVFMGEGETYRPVRDRLAEWIDALP